MKKHWILCLALLCLALCACGAETEDPAYPIDYGSSRLYSRAEMDEAIRLIRQEFARWDGCEMHAIRYGGDGLCSEGNLAWLNELAPAMGLEPFTDCICFVSDFHSPKEVPVTEAWNSDFEYTDWQWWLGRTADGRWHLVTWGY